MKFTARLRAVGLLLLLPLLSPSCAKVGDPLPPPVQVPSTPVAIRLIQEGGRFVHLAFSLPSNDVAQIELYRACGDEEFGDPVVTVLVQQADRLPDGSVKVTDAQPLFDSPCRYALRLVDSQQNRSSLSGSVQTSEQVPPLPPTGLRAEVREDEIVLSWNPPEQNIEGEPIGEPAAYLINSEVFVNEPQYRDTEFEFGQPATYQIHAVASRQDPVILSEPGETLTLVPRDVFPPETPVNVNAVLVGNNVQLVWDVVESNDLQGYIIYRGSDREDLQRISPVVTANRYLDQKVPARGPLFYQVSAVDQDDNEGDRSEVVSVRPGN